MFLSGRQVLSNTIISEMSRFSGPGQEEKQTLQASTSYFLPGDRLQALVEAIVAFVNAVEKALEGPSWSGMTFALCSHNRDLMSLPSLRWSRVTP